MNQQQLQNARAAHWRQKGAPAADDAGSSAALLTLHDALPWLEEIGLCLFLPRHAQLPAPAPSFVEAVMGTASMTPPPAAIATAMDLVTRLVAEGKAIPLNLLGSYTEQPDFLVTLEALPWVAAVRGDRQWKKAPGGRTAPIVLRTWELLERDGGRTVAEIREELGRELTEAAVQRALIELWTTLRVVPAYATGEATRWSLLKDGHARELTTGSNTAQATALSALISLYLRQAVAATPEEAEIFLSPLTARSRIREVVHGMQATRFFGATTVGSHTVLFVEGSLPESALEAEEEPEETKQPTTSFETRRPAARDARAERPGREPRQAREPGARPFRPADMRRPAARQPDRERENRPGAESAEKRREWKPRNDSPRREGRRTDGPGSLGPRRTDRPGFAGAKRPGGFRPDRKERVWPARNDKMSAANREGGPQRKGTEGPRGTTGREGRSRPEGRGGSAPRPWQKKGPQREFPAKPFSGERRSDRPDRPKPNLPPGERPRSEGLSGERPDRSIPARGGFAGKRPYKSSRPEPFRPERRGAQRARPEGGRPSAGPPRARPEGGRPSAGPPRARPEGGRPSAGPQRIRPEGGRPEGGRPSAGPPRTGRFTGRPGNEERRRFNGPSGPRSRPGAPSRPARKGPGKGNFGPGRTPFKKRSPRKDEDSK